MNRFTERLLYPQPLVLDAAIGTALIARGLDLTRDTAAHWALSNPAVVRALQRSHVRARAWVLLTDTFGQRAPSALERDAAIRLARGAFADEGRAGFVGLSLWAGLPAREVRQALQGLDLGAVDALWLETGTSGPVAVDALLTARETGLPVVVTMAFTALAHDFSSWLETLAREGAVAVGLNCSPWPREAGGLARLARDLAFSLPVPLVLKPDAGGLHADDWARELWGAVGAGARLVGGCCGTGSEHLAALGAMGRGPKAALR